MIELQSASVLPLKTLGPKARTLMPGVQAELALDPRVLAYNLRHAAALIEHRVREDIAKGAK